MMIPSLVWWGLKNGYQRDIYLKEIGLRAQNMIIILDSTINIIGGGGGTYMPFNEHENIHFHKE